MRCADLGDSFIERVALLLMGYRLVINVTHDEDSQNSTNAEQDVAIFILGVVGVGVSRAFSS